jgi:hypothetical protein
MVSRPGTRPRRSSSAKYFSTIGQYMKTLSWYWSMVSRPGTRPSRYSSAQYCSTIGQYMKSLSWYWSMVSRQGTRPSRSSSAQYCSTIGQYTWKHCLDIGQWSAGPVSAPVGPHLHNTVQLLVNTHENTVLVLVNGQQAGHTPHWSLHDNSDMILINGSAPNEQLIPLDPLSTIL